MSVSQPLKFLVLPPGICHLEAPTLEGSRPHPGYPGNASRAWYDYAFVHAQRHKNLNVRVPTTHMSVGDRVVVSIFSGWLYELPAVVIQASHLQDGLVLVPFPANMMISCQGKSAHCSYRIERTPCVIAVSNPRRVRMESRIPEAADVRTPAFVRPRILQEAGRRVFFIPAVGLTFGGKLEISCYDDALGLEVERNLPLPATGADFRHDITPWFNRRKSPRGWFAYSLSKVAGDRVFSELREYDDW
ncbi:hypothetical protein ACCE15_21745 [Pseudomonas parafulva]|uniref:hypothetical protein n=1 Tax=Pseudomonas TaxID=286 RepID=UPI0006D496E1|nr:MULTISPECIES: hypothetical protein [unclassified Pseudomonas]HEK0906210.1 hypothetical protein [Pseudomonas putida]HEK1768204.1 hypothetical protein [Pseudomonas putida]